MNDIKERDQHRDSNWSLNSLDIERLISFLDLSLVLVYMYLHLKLSTNAGQNGSHPFRSMVLMCFERNTPLEACFKAERDILSFEGDKRKAVPLSGLARCFRMAWEVRL